MRWRTRSHDEQVLADPDVHEHRLDLTDPFVAYLIAADAPVDVRDVDVDTPLVRALRAADVELVVPVVSHGDLVSLLSLGPRKGGRSYNAEDRRLLHRLATQAAPALRLAEVMRVQAAQASERERIAQELRVARLIQQQFLPTTLPEIPGWNISSYYQPAREVGGDFYDVLTLPDGRLGIVIGDVSGKGVPAALVMATTRSLLREIAQQAVEPGAVLERVNRALVSDIPGNMFVTCQYAAIDPARGQVTLANAGHSLPFIVDDRGACEVRATGMPLGIMAESRYDECSAVVAAGGYLLFHSDGLAEARNGSGEMFGLPRLRSLITSPWGDDLIEALIADLDHFADHPTEVDDDVTLLTVQRTGEAARVRAVDARTRILADFTIASVAGNERIAAQRVAAVAEELAVGASELERLRTAVVEGVMNAIEHGNQFRKDALVEVRVLASAGTLTVEVVDEGGDVPIGDVPVPDLSAKLAGTQSPRGWGLFLMKEMVDDLHMETVDGKHRVRMSVHLGRSEA
jgi:serine phosphatase RsbU (regulator of sigma subunit)/anti-sigma regulatory factor (Ser/Thr protein kinase)